VAEQHYGDAKSTARSADPQAKQKALQRARERYESNPSADHHLAYANALFDDGRYAEAEQQLRNIVAAHGEEPHVMFDLGFTYKNLKLPEDAQQVWLRLVELHPKNPLAKAAESEVWRMNPDYKPSWMRK
jgi:Flp pilus assembly protein TadD